MLKMRQFGRSEIKATRKMWSSYFSLIIDDVKEVFTVRSILTEDMDAGKLIGALSLLCRDMYVIQS
jgi:hypothetical protein